MEWADHIRIHGIGLELAWKGGSHGVKEGLKARIHGATLRAKLLATFLLDLAARLQNLEQHYNSRFDWLNTEICVTLGEYLFAMFGSLA